MTILDIFKVLLRIKDLTRNMSILLGKLFFLRLKRNFVSRWLVLGIDIFLVSCSILLAIGVRANFKLERISGYDVYFALPTIVGVYSLAFLMHKSYFGIIRHTSIADIWRILKANTFAIFALTFIVTAADYFNYYYLQYISISFLIIHFLIATFVLVVSRFIFKTAYFELTESKQSHRKNVLIYGAGKLGLLTHHSLTQSGLYKVIGFVDDNRSIKGKSIEGIPVYSSKEVLDPAFLQKKDIVEAIISIQKIKPQRKREIIDQCLALNLSVKAIPPVDQWINGELTAGQIKEVKIEDLLGREAIRLGKGKIRKELEDKVIMITGAAGSIGRELVIQSLYCASRRIILVDQSETGLFELEHEIRDLMEKTVGSTTDYVVQIADVSNEQAMSELFAKHSPDILFHAAAYKHVPLMEQNPREALRCNIKGTKILADMAVKYKVAKFVMVSTDKAVNPTNVMGASKRIAEMYVQSLDMHLKKQGIESTRFITTRFGNVLGSNGSVIPLFKKQILKGGPITVTHPDITRYFMTIPEACQLVMEAGVMGLGGEIFIFDMGESVKIVDLARKMIKLSGLKPDADIKIEYTGLREGEKLYEELLNNKETTVATHHPKIMIAQVRNVDHGMLKAELERTIELNYKLNEFDMVRVMKKLVPEFVSNSSKFELLDNNKDVLYQ
jgi:FlaA1/EpsC-like NDP-sugar epimerase